MRHTWQDFGANRTLVAREARSWVEECGWPADRTYLLFLDADMELEAAPAFDKQGLEATYYQVVQEAGTLSYWNIRLALRVPIIHPCWSGSMPVSVEGAAESVPSVDIEMRDPLRISEIEARDLLGIGDWSGPGLDRAEGPAGRCSL